MDFIGAGQTTDKERVRIADNLGVLFVGWALGDLRVYDQGSEYYTLCGKLREDLVRLANMLRCHSKVVWIIGGDGPTYGLSPSFTAVQAEVCTLLRAEGQVVWTGANMVNDLAEWVHVREDN